MSDPVRNIASISLPEGFVFGEKLPSASIRSLGATATAVAPAPSLGPLADFTGSWVGNGFNTIFRPDNTISKSSESLPKPLAPGDNILELNLTTETLTFSPSLGSVPNRGLSQQQDIHLNGVPYLQAINDVTDPAHPVGIHAEPGLWMIVEPTTNPAEGPTVVRMGSIPHGTTIEAQGTSKVIAGPPVFPSLDITPQPIGGGTPIPFPSQKAANNDTPRTPQDLSTFIAAGTITQAILDNPNVVLQNHLKGQTIVSTTQISIATSPAPPLVGGGTDNIAFLTKNAVGFQMSATFWIETVQHTITVPVSKAGQPLVIKAAEIVPGLAVPTFSVTPPKAITVPLPIKVTSKQIQYTQTVVLNFNGLSWPHVSVATLVPAAPVVVPATAFA